MYGPRLAPAHPWCGTTVTTPPTSLAPSAHPPSRARSPGIGAAIIAPAANMECINLHLQEISTQVAPGAVAVLIWDGAGWHQTGGDLEVPDNIVLLSLPLYSPNETGWRTSENTCVPTSYRAASGTTTALSSIPAQQPGTGSSVIGNACARSAPVGVHGPQLHQHFLA